MRKRFQLPLALVFILIFAAIPKFAISEATAAKLSGDLCPKLGSSQIVSGIKYYCSTEGIKLVWDSGMPVKVKPGTKLQFSHYCQPDPLIPSEWAAYEQFAIKTFNCARPYRFVKETLPTSKPKSILAENRTTLETCKITQSRAKDNSSAQIAFSALNSPD